MTIQEVIEELNKALEDDPKAFHDLICRRTPCNEAFANNAVIYVDEKNGRFSVGTFGLLNGVLKAFGQPRIAVKFHDGKILGFVEYLEP